MFYVHEILHRRKGKFGLLWLAATSPKSVRHVKLLNISLAKLSEDLQRELTKGIFGNKSLRFSLRLSCQLIMGLWVLYRRKAALVRGDFHDACNTALQSGDVGFWPPLWGVDTGRLLAACPRHAFLCFVLFLLPSFTDVPPYFTAIPS
ncbi:uncharacterized protein [Dermacentor albipictus]|uniref:uncharacterized protein n=1 Tax=Dermacentor albipictus TaxID=60249 RepID=UPI0031FC8028